MQPLEERSFAAVGLYVEPYFLTDSPQYGAIRPVRQADHDDFLIGARRRYQKAAAGVGDDHLGGLRVADHGMPRPGQSSAQAPSHEWPFSEPIYDGNGFTLG